MGLTENDGAGNRELKRTEAVFELSARAQLEPFSAHWVGNVLSQVACVTSRALPLESAVTEALGKAFAALGYVSEPLFFVSTAAFSGAGLIECIEAENPQVVVALDRAAGQAVAESYDVQAPSSGIRASVLGRPFVVVDDFPASLDQMEKKRIAWHQLQASALK